MKKTLFLSDWKVVNNEDNKYVAPYVFYCMGEWREDSWYFNDMEKIKKSAKEAGYIIK